MDKENNNDNAEQMQFGSEKLKVFFISHLDKIYCAKQHLLNRLPLLLTQAHYSDLKSAIQQTVAHVENEISRMEIIYTMLEANYANCEEKVFTGLIEAAFRDIQTQGPDKELRDLSILFYLQNIESMEMASFQVLQMAAIKLKSKQVSTLLKENYEEAKADRTLFLLITSKYITAKH